MGGIAKEFYESNGNIKYTGLRLVIELWSSVYFNSLRKIKQILQFLPLTCQATFFKTYRTAICGYRAMGELSFFPRSLPLINQGEIDKYPGSKKHVLSGRDAYCCSPDLHSVSFILPTLLTNKIR